MAKKEVPNRDIRQNATSNEQIVPIIRNEFETQKNQDHLADAAREERYEEMVMMKPEQPQG